MNPLRIRVAHAFFALRVEATATPVPIRRPLHQTAFYRIEVHVVDLFVFLLRSPHVEVVEPALPESGTPVTYGFFPHFPLTFDGSSPLSAQSPRNSLLQNLHYNGRISYIWFTDQQVNVLGHHDVAKEREVIALADLAQYLQELFSLMRRGEKSHPPITAASNEMEMAETIAAL